MAFIQIKNLKKTYERGKIKALRGVNLKLEKGDFVAIMGPSGCGKSTLLYMIGALDLPDSGEIVIDGKTLAVCKDLAKFRSQKIGFIFQLHNLIPTLTAFENVMIPMFETRMGFRARQKKARELLKLVGLEHRQNLDAPKLSGGERQRVAVARALANDPEILIADEPTGSLDSKSSREILELLCEVRKKTKKTIIMVTHEKSAAVFADRIFKMIDGRIL